MSLLGLGKSLIGGALNTLVVGPLATTSDIINGDTELTNSADIVDTIGDDMVDVGDEFLDIFDL